MPDLAEQLRSLSDVGQPVSADEVVRRVERRRRRIVGAVSAVAVVLAALGAVAAWPHADGERRVVTEPDVEEEPPPSESAASAVLDEHRVTIRVAPQEVEGLRVEVGPPVAAAGGETRWFRHEVRFENTSDRTIRFEDVRTSRFLGEPAQILVAEPGCGVATVEPTSQPRPGACRAYGREMSVAPGGVHVEEWWVSDDIEGLAPVEPGTFVYDKELEYRIGGGFPFEATIRVVYEIEDVPPPDAPAGGQSAVLDGYRIAITAEAPDVEGIRVEVGPPVAVPEGEDGWFRHEVRYVNGRDEVLQVSNAGEGLDRLGDPPRLYVTDPSCGLGSMDDEPGFVCIGAGQWADLAPGEHWSREWTVWHDVVELEPLAPGTYARQATLYYRLGASGPPEPSSMEQTTIRVIYEIEQVAE